MIASMAQYILRRKTTSRAVTVAALKATLAARPGLSVMDESSDSVLVELDQKGDEPFKLDPSLEGGWEVFPVRTVPAPRTRPMIRPTKGRK
jgi:hypothetical protein